jgi:hypothetical protein
MSAAYPGTTQKDSYSSVNGSYRAPSGTSSNQYAITKTAIDIMRANGSVNLLGAQLHSIRVYNRALTQNEMNDNYLIDRARFLAPPVVKIGAQTCENLEIVSSTEMRCLIPKSDHGISAQAGETVTLTFGGKTIQAEKSFTYKTFSLISVSPNTGNVDGGNIITINGANFPYAGVESYVTDGLVAHYDAINNIGLGDIFHSDASDTWVDLSNSKANLALNAGDNAFESNAFLVKDDNNYFRTSYFDNLPSGNDSFSAEIRYEIAGSVYGSDLYPVAWGTSNNGKISNLGFRSATALGHTFSSNYIDAPYANAKTKPNTLSVSYKSSAATAAAQKAARKLYVNGTLLKYTHGGSDGLTVNVAKANLNIGANHSANVKIQSVRIYNRVLDISEIGDNSSIDARRFVNPPVVKIDGQNCTSVIVLSPEKLQCKAPSGSTGTAKNVTVTDATNADHTLESAYTYMATGAIVDGIDPKIGPSFGGSKIRLSGSSLQLITRVTIAGKECTDSILADENTTYTCTVPKSDVADYVDVIAETVAGNIALTRAFQYVNAKRSPVEFNVE